MNKKFDLIIATDVLEHFKDLSLALTFINKFLKTGAYLLVTLPTENYIYELGRKIVNKEKPIDHYHSSKEVISYILESGFSKVYNMKIPKYIINIPLFDLAVFKKF